jgi:hypothetical protein
MRIAMMATTTRTSTRVNAERDRLMEVFLKQGAGLPGEGAALLFQHGTITKYNR